MSGQDVKITCTSNGQPDPSFTIIHNGTYLYNSIITFVGNTYTIQKANLSDAGNYTCVATNKLGSHKSKPLFLNVTVKGKFSCKDVYSFSCKGVNHFNIWKQVRISSPFFQKSRGRLYKNVVKNPLHDRGFASMYIMAAALHANLSKFVALFLGLYLIWRQETLYAR